jgi:hypothetical protein
VIPTVTLPSGQSVRLGAILVPQPKPTLQLARYLAPYLAVAPPVSVDNTTKAMDAISQMYGNDRAGDCVVAGNFQPAVFGPGWRAERPPWGRRLRHLASTAQSVGLAIKAVL